MVLAVCLTLNYYQQTAEAEATAKILRENTQSLQTLAPKINTLAQQQDSLQQMLKAAVDISVQRDTWSQILTALNEKIPSGFWITELIPVSNAAALGADNPHPDAPMNEVGMLVVSGFYHSYSKTMEVNPDRLRDFVNALGRPALLRHR